MPPAGFEKTIFIISLVLNGNLLLFASFLFFKKSENRKANKILAFGLISIVFINLALSLLNTGFYFRFPHFTSIHLPFLFIIILFPYFYFQAVLEPDFKFKKQHLLHLVLPFLVLCYSFQRQYLKPISYKIDFLQNHLYDRHYLFAILVYIQFIIYIILIIRKYRHIKMSLTLNNPDDIKVVKWLKEYIWIILLIFAGELFPVFFIPFNLDPLLFIPLVNSIIFYLLLFKAIVNPAIFLKLGQIKYTMNTGMKKTFVLKEHTIQQLRQQLDETIKNKVLFFKPEMSLAFLAKELNIPEHHLTYLLTHNYHHNFKDLVNSIRIEEVKKRLIDPENNKLTIEAISESVGFTSRITFHNVFKKQTGQTPADYKRCHS